MGQVGRRHFLIAAGALLAAPLARGQRAAKVYRGGLLQSSSSSLNVTDAATGSFETMLREFGYFSPGVANSAVEGGHAKKLIWVKRIAKGADEQLPAFAADLVGLKVDVVVAIGARAAMAAKRASSTIPIVMLVEDDPVKLGLVATLGRPGGNVTGVAAIAAELAAKRLGLLKEMVPALTRVAVLWNSSDSTKVDEWRETEAAAKQLGIELQSFEATSIDGIESVLDALRKTDAGALLVFSDRLTWVNTPAIAELAVEQRLPAMSGGQRFTWSFQRGLMYYGPVNFELVRRTAALVAKILDGAKPADLPVERPSVFELRINAGTAKAIGITIPSSLLLRADQVIE